MTKPLVSISRALLLTTLLLPSNHAVDLDEFGKPAPQIETHVDYGVDVSFPIHRGEVSTNYPWLPHNVDPENNPTPKEYRGMPLQKLGNKKKFYDDFMQGCYDKYQKGKNGGMCDATEKDRVAMSLRQPKDMTVRICIRCLFCGRRRIWRQEFS